MCSKLASFAFVDHCVDRQKEGSEGISPLLLLKKRLSPLTVFLTNEYLERQIEQKEYKSYETEREQE